MPINSKNQRTFHRTLYAGLLQTVKYLKRGYDQQQGTVTTYLLFQVRWGKVHKSGEPIQKSMTSSNSRRLHIPIIEMERNGLEDINAADRFVDQDGRYWQPESGQTITRQLAEQWINVDCLRSDPPTGT